MTSEWIARVQRTMHETQRSHPVATAWRLLTVGSKRMFAARENRRLRVAESVSLGDRRFVVLLEADNEHYLVGASAAGVTLLTRLGGAHPHDAADTLPNGGEQCTAESGLKVAALRPGAAAAAPKQHTPEVTPSYAQVQAELLAGSGPGTAASVSPAVPKQQDSTLEPKLSEVALHAAVPLASAGMRRHAFPVGRMLALLFALQLLLPVRSLPGQGPGTAAATSTTHASAIPNSTTRSTPDSKNNQSGLSLTGLGGNSAPWTIVVLLTVLTLIPSLMICMTPFARLLVVFHFLRQALGLQTTPSNQTLIGLSLILTFFLMEPVGKQIYNSSFVPLQSGQITALEAVDRGSEPLRHFMAHYVREKDAALFLEIAHAPRPKSIDDVSLRVLMPAYIVSELKAGFQIGAVLFLPFLVVDIVIASITTSVGMMQLPPVVISTPLKLMLFLMVDGWHLLIGALVRSFY